MSHTTITFANGETFNTTLAPIGGTETYQSAHRRTLEVRIPSDSIGFDELCNNIYTNADATKHIIVAEHTEKTAEDGTVSDEVIAQSVHLNYTLPMEMTFKTVDGTQIFSMKLAQKSDVELEVESLRAAVDAMGV